MDTIRDFADLLEALDRCEVRYLIVGGLAFIYHAKPRFTKDMDVWVEPAAANLERAGKPVPKNLSEGIAGSERSIHDAYGTILDRENQKDAVRARFGQDLERFRMLNNLTSSRRQAQNQIQDHGLAPVLHNIVPCGDAVECDRLWKKAETYVHEHATTIVQPGGSNILITDPPTSENDISLILARINDKGSNGAYLFLDLQCQGTIRGRPMCQSQEAKSIIEGFRPALTGEDASNP